MTTATAAFRRRLAALRTLPAEERLECVIAELDRQEAVATRECDCVGDARRRLCDAESQGRLAVISTVRGVLGIEGAR